MRHLASHVATTLAATTILEDRGKKWGEAPEGYVQGDPNSAAEYCVAWQEQVVHLDTMLSRAGGMARLIMDDAYSVGPADILFPAIQRFENEILEECGLSLQRTKCEVFT